ncbi:hypothetical protein FRC01_013518 [Tulasnella sp. 417]|nr:hypothetical protein FRC01_013518 [Tulasnella sp. 417]
MLRSVSRCSGRQSLTKCTYTERIYAGRVTGRLASSVALEGQHVAYRTRGCQEVNAEDAGQTVRLAGWLSAERKISKKASFYSLRDASGIIQLIVRRSGEGGIEDPLSRMSRTPEESVVSVLGRVKLRPQSSKNANVSTGDVELEVEGFELLNAADELPFYPHDEHNLANEDLRAKYRYLDLRRPALANNIKMRSKVARAVRNVLHNNGKF